MTNHRPFFIASVTVLFCRLAPYYPDMNSQRRRVADVIVVGGLMTLAGALNLVATA